MTTKRETAMAALEAVLVTAFSGPEVFERDPEKTPQDNTGGNVIMRDGDPGTPDISLSPIQYQFNHAVFVELSSSGENRNAIVDGLQVKLDTALKLDRTLGAVVIDCRVMEAPIIDEIDTEGVETVRAATVSINLCYVSDSPIG